MKTKKSRKSNTKKAGSVITSSLVLPGTKKRIEKLEKKHATLPAHDFGPLLEDLREQRDQMVKEGILPAINHEDAEMKAGTAMYALQLILFQEAKKICKPADNKQYSNKEYVLLSKNVQFAVALIMYHLEDAENALSFIKSRYERQRQSTPQAERKREELLDKEEFRPSEVAKVFRVDPKTVWRWIKQPNGLKQEYPHGSIKRDDCIEFADRRKDLKDFALISYELKSAKFRSKRGK